ncbi:MAG TPA: sulfotransferase domain-containing protein, partial [Pirellulales bacterium]|nr:sulfotransferase domain-containing protein [Pirellulales bacterium]
MLSWLISNARAKKSCDHLFIACMPKSGSTYLSTVLQEVTGFPASYVSEWGEQNEGDICERRLRRLKRRSVIQQHIKCTQTNLKWMVKYGVRPIVLTRSLFDVVPSMHDHLVQKQGGLTCGYVRREFWTLCWSDRCDYLIQTHLPWYFNFLLSWRDAAEQLAICPMSYEQLFADQVASLTIILDFHQIRASQDQLAAAIARAPAHNTRFNVGVSGRGSRTLT